MIRLNLALWAAVVASALYLVHVQYESRRLYVAMEKAQAQARQLAAEHEQLQVQKRAQAAPARVQQLAVNRLGMRAANPAITEYVNPPAGAMPQGSAQ